MRCPYCSCLQTKVTDKRDSEGVTRRRRECLRCGKRFTTYERVELELKVLKKDGKREAFESNKLRRGVEIALEKRPLSDEEIDDMMEEIEAKINQTTKGKEIKSEKIGEIVMSKLKKVDKIAYIRFASVYRDFADLDDFKKEMRGLK